MTTTATVRRARTLAVLGLVLAVAALAVALFSGLAAIVLGSLSIVSAAIAWLRSDPSTGGGRGLAATSLVLSVLAGILAAASSGIDAPLTVQSPTQAVVTDLAGGDSYEVVIDGLDVVIGAVRADEASPAGVAVPVEVANVGADERTVELHLVALDAADRTLATDTVPVRGLGPGLTVTVTAFADVEHDVATALQDARVRVKDVVDTA